MAASNDKANHAFSNPKKKSQNGGGAFKPSSASNEATYTSCDRDLIYAVIVEVTKAGGAIRFGLTSDGGAFALGVFSNGQQSKVYVGANDDINATLQEIGEFFHGQVPNDSQKSG